MKVVELLNMYQASERDFRGVNLHDADLYRAHLCGINLRDANLYRANLCNVNLFGADLRGANLREANLRGADLRRVNLFRADLRRADLSGAIGNFSVFKFQQHDGICAGGYLSIGCERHPIEYWLELCVEIGAKYGYTDVQVSAYCMWIQMCTKLE